jgi:hypothetical protein
MTIRIRRVKCDEAKPTCKRCATFDVICDGYISNSTVSGSSSSTKRLLPRLPLSSCRQTPLQYTHSRLLFKTEQEHRYFQIFCLQTAPKFIWHFLINPLVNLVLQTCETEPAIRHAIVAIGALNFTSSTPSDSENEPLNPSRRFAFQEYGHAISQIKQRLAGKGGEAQLRTTLIACLLFTRFEAFHGFLDQAIAQVYAGVKMMEDWLRQ